MMKRYWLPFCALALALAAGCAAPADKSSPPDQAHGGELYRTTCIVCHTAQVHWREKRLVRSWDDLVFQVSRWQRIAGQDWSREDINDVAAYLNREFYDLPCQRSGCGSAALPSRRATSQAPLPSRSAPRRTS
jgi:hypothetical protein